MTKATEKSLRDKGMYITNAVVEMCDLTIEPMFSLDMRFQWTGSGQGWIPILGNSSEYAIPHYVDFTGPFLAALIKIFDVEYFTKIKGKNCRIGKEDEYGVIVGIGHIIEDDWLMADDFYTSYHYLNNFRKRCLEDQDVASNVKRAHSELVLDIAPKCDIAKF